jgi:hypothetical protein
VNVALKNDRDEVIVHARSAFVSEGLEVGAQRDFEVRYTIRSPKLAPGHYFLTVHAVVRGEQVVLWMDGIDACVVGARAYFGRAQVLAGFRAPIIPEFAMAVESSTPLAPAPQSTPRPT